MDSIVEALENWGFNDADDVDSDNPKPGDVFVTERLKGPAARAIMRRCGIRPGMLIGAA